MPGLDGGDGEAGLFQSGAAGVEEVPVQAVTGEGGNAGLPAALGQGLGVVEFVVVGGVVALHGGDGRGEHGQRELLAKELQAGVHTAILRDGVQIQVDLLPGIVVPGSHGAGALGAGAGDGVFAGDAVADGAGMAQLQIAAGGLDRFFVSHRENLLEFF